MRAIAVLTLAAGLAAAGPNFAQESGAAQHLEKQGFARCAKSAGSVLDFLYEKQSYGYLNTWHRGTPDGHAATTLALRSQGDVLAALTAAPAPAGGCDVAFSQLAPLAQPCAKVQETTFKDWKKSGELSGLPVYSDPSAPNVVVLLVPTGQASCLVVKSGILYL